MRGPPFCCRLTVRVKVRLVPFPLVLWSFPFLLRQVRFLNLVSKANWITISSYIPVCFQPQVKITPEMKNSAIVTPCQHKKLYTLGLKNIIDIQSIISVSKGPTRSAAQLLGKSRILVTKFHFLY